MAKRVFYKEEARRRILGGAEQLYNAVKETYGPKAGNVVIGHPYSNPTVTHDGVTVANAIELPDEDNETLGYRVGAELIKEASNQLNRLAGDGTTTVTVLTYHILNEANKLLAAGYNAQLLRREIEAGAQSVLDVLEYMKEDVEAKDIAKLTQIATISAGDEKLGAIIADVMSKLGKDGIITVEASQGTEIEAEIKEGYVIDSGWTSPYFINDNEKQVAVIEKPSIIIIDHAIAKQEKFMFLVQALAELERKDIVLIADEVTGDALNVLVYHKMKGTLNVAVMKAPALGDRRKDMLQDIALATGGMVLTEGLLDSMRKDTAIKSAVLDHVGTAAKIIIGQDQTTIIEGDGNKKSIDTRVKELLAREVQSEFEKAQLNKRAATLNGKIAVMKVGGITETEVEERKYRVDDAIAATQAALKGGITAGGGTTLLYLSDTIANSSAGFNVLSNALKQPFMQIMENAGYSGEVCMEKVQEANKVGSSIKAAKIAGININSGTRLANMFSVGVIDPALVTKEVIKNSVSVAATAITMSALVVDIPEKPQNT